MAYIGNTVENQGFTPAIDYFNGNGVTVTFTLSRPVASVAQVIVAIDNVIQNPNSAFTVAGNAITFSSAPLSGTNNIWVEYTSLITSYAAISQDPTVIGDIRATGGYLAEGDFGNSFVDGAILDYVTGNGRITVGDLDGLTIYNGGTAARTALTTFTSAGNVGIGTASPTRNLTVYGTNATIAVQNSTTGATSSDGMLIQQSGNDAYLWNLENSFFSFGTNNNERMRISSGGSLLVGTTASLGGKVNIEAGTSGQTTPIMIGNGAGTARAAMNYDIDNIRLGFGCGTSPTTNGVYLTNGGTSWTSASDERLKENLASITDAINKVILLRAVTGNFIADETKTSKAFLIAQDIQKVLPEAVDASDPTRLGVQYQDVIPLLVAAIQELNAKVTALEAKLEAK
jgi:hypothetical protein